MELDMHFYGIYALARAAGVKPEIAKIIAYSSQFVDDSIEDEAIILNDQSAIIPTMTSHKPIDYQNTIPGDQWRVWVPFHFLPGNDSTARTFVEKMVCTKNSTPAQQILKFALKLREEVLGPHLAGIVAHVYADTFSHYGFSGLSNEGNKVKNDSIKIYVKSRKISNYVTSKAEKFFTKISGVFVESVCPVGHGAVATYPDRPYLHWEYEYESGKKAERKNMEDFTEACRLLHGFFSEFIKDNALYGDPLKLVSWNLIHKKIKNILKQEEPMVNRIKLWKDAISSTKLFEVIEEDKDIKYSKEDWGSDSIVRHFAKSGTVDNCDGCLFIRASWKYRNYVIDELLPAISLTIAL
ncbi:MAG: hypothetical protein HY999_01065 [Nitrospinae bacterium]|nr:hypothetical protein [Nitrospinota bacterium]